MNLTEIKKKEAYLEEEFQWADKIILVAEDIELNFMYIHELLEPTGAMIVRAENGKKAVDYCLANNKVDLILMDILMPVMSGYDATRNIKAVRNNIPIIAQTAYALTEDRSKALAAGCDDFIAKPISREELLRKINKLINRS
jgi:CheY-like chemotaxis protein